MSFNSSFYKLATVVLLAAGLYSCGTQQAHSAPPADTLAVQKPVPSDSAAATDTDNDTTDFALVYVTIADTGQDYYQLRSLMTAVNTKLGWPIDTMDRYYNVRKKEIVVSDTDEDEIYRGSYFPRRLPSQTLSLEYYRTYNDTTSDKNIALVTGIYESQQTADSALTILRCNAPKAFSIHSNVYVGCMH